MLADNGVRQGGTGSLRGGPPKCLEHLICSAGLQFFGQMQFFLQKSLTGLCGLWLVASAVINTHVKTS
jgi:hypothetical protein